MILTRKTSLMKWLKILLIWFCFIPIAILNGGLREYVLNQYFPTNKALIISGVLLSLFIFLITGLFLPRVKSFSRLNSIQTGVLWMILTVCFEFGFGLATGTNWKELMEAYNLSNGNLWIIVVLSTFLAPILFAGRNVAGKK